MSSKDTARTVFQISRHRQNLIRSHAHKVPAVRGVEVSARGRRRFTVEYKTRIVQEAAHCRAAGEIGSLLRREGLCSSQLTTWRKQYHAGARGAVDFDPEECIGAPAARTDKRVWRDQMTATLHTHGAKFGVSTLTAALGVPRSSACRWRRPPAPPPVAGEAVAVAHTPSPRALSPAAQTRVLAYLRGLRFVDCAPA